MNASQIAPPLDLDLFQYDTSMPLLADGIYDFLIEKAEIRETNDKAGRYVALDLKTNNPATSLKGDALNAGVHVFDNLMLNPTGASNWDMVLRNIAGFTQALKFSPGQAKVVNGQINAVDWVPSLAGKTVRSKIGNKPEGVNSKTGKAFRAKNIVVLYLN